MWDREVRGLTQNYLHMCLRRANKTIQFNELKMAKADIADDYFSEIMELEENRYESQYAVEMHKKTSIVRDKMAELEKQMEYIYYMKLRI